jgi:hypothetical protein
MVTWLSSPHFLGSVPFWGEFDQVEVLFSLSYQPYYFTRPFPTPNDSPCGDSTTHGSEDADLASISIDVGDIDEAHDAGVADFR